LPLLSEQSIVTLVVTLCVCGHRISLGSEGNVLYPMLLVRVVILFLRCRPTEDEGKESEEENQITDERSCCGM